jgi:cytochrome P450
VAEATRTEPGGPSGCPVLSGYDPLSAGVLEDPFPSYARARSEEPVFYVEEFDLWHVSRRQDVLEVLRSPHRFSNRNVKPMPLPPEELRDRMPVYPNATALLFLDEPEHRPARQMVQAPFTPRRLRELAPLIRARAEELLRVDDPDRRLEFIHQYATPLALVVIGSILGVPEQDFSRLERSIQGAFRIRSGACGEEETRALALEQLDYWEYVCALVDDRRAHPREDFSSVLANHVKADGSTPTTEEVAAHLNTILGAGFETSANMMSFGIRSLLENRDQWELLQSDRSLVANAVEECARHRTIIKTILRVTTADTELAGVPIPEGARLALMIASANRDESEFDEPDRFDITRGQDNLTFGRGLHFCLGAPLAKLEMRTTLEALLDLAPDVRLVEGQRYEYRPDIRIDAMLALELDLGPVPPREAATA